MFDGWALFYDQQMRTRCKQDGCDRQARRFGVCGEHTRTHPNVPRCTADGCRQPQLSLKLCATHYGHQHRGIALMPVLTANNATCIGPECARPARHRPGLCDRHKAQQKSRGEMWVIGTRKRPGRPPVTVCKQAGCDDTVLWRFGRCYEHALAESGECWVTDCVLPGDHRSGLCDPHRRREARLRHDYDTGFEQLIDMYTACSSRCEICGRPGHIVTAPLHIDHCHDGGGIRGLLCGDCNRGIGLLRDAIRLRAAADYLERGC